MKTLAVQVRSDEPRGEVSPVVATRGLVPLEHCSSGVKIRDALRRVLKSALAGVWKI